MSHGWESLQCSEINSHLTAFVRILLENITVFTFISLQHILVSLSKFLLLGTVHRQQTRYEAGHGGCASLLVSGGGSVRRLPQWAAPAPAQCPALFPLLRRTSRSLPQLNSNIPSIFERWLKKKTHTSANLRNYGEKSSVYLNERYINAIYPLWLSVSVREHTVASVGILICLWSLLEHQRPGKLCSLLQTPTHPDECISERQRRWLRPQIGAAPRRNCIRTQASYSQLCQRPAAPASNMFPGCNGRLSPRLSCWLQC